jgi:catechol 2,3-dioxygenase-like lactoylglutathione lyase family enzyme
VQIAHLFAGMAVTDFAAAYEWYERLFGRPPDMLPQEGEAVWTLTSGGSIYVTANPDGAGTGLATIAVSDLDAQVGALFERGVAVGQVPSKPGAVRRAIVRDPDGNTITFFQA